MTHTEFAKYLKKHGFAVTAKALKAYAKGDKTGFSSQLQQFLEDFMFLDSEGWVIDDIPF